MTEPDEQYRLTDLEVFPAGGNVALVHARDGSAARFVRGHIVDLMAQCDEFRTLEDHLRLYGRRRNIGAAGMRALRGELRKLAQSGLLDSRSVALQTVEGPDASSSSPGVSAIGFPTRDRVETLQRSVTSYLDNGRRFGRTDDLVVMDDSLDVAVREAYRRMLGVLKSAYGGRVYYAGLEEKTAYARRLADEGGLPPDVTRFACVGDDRYGVTTVGANRNAILLHMVGDVFLSADDDTVCRSGRPPDRREGVAISSQGFPEDVRFFPNREAAARSVCDVDHDVVASHEGWLGGSLKLLPSSEVRDSETSLEDAEPGLLRRLRARACRVALTVNGTVGDCAWDNPHFYLFRQGAAFGRLVHSEEEYRVARSSREVVQAVSRPTLTETAYPLLAMCIGLDNRRLLPPFAPVGKGEEVVFGATLTKCFDDAFAVRVPWCVTHAPPQQRSLSSRHMFSVGPNLALYCIQAFDPGLTRSSDEKLLRLGNHLQDVGRMTQGAFEEFIRWHKWDAMSARISALEDRLQADPPPYFQQDAEAVISAMRRSALDPIEELYELEGGRETLQGLLVRFGQLLIHWPRMVETARSLRTQGVRLARQI